MISPFPTCGTTWLQQIVHSLRTGGDMAFDDIRQQLHRDTGRRIDELWAATVGAATGLETYDDLVAELSARPAPGR